MTHPAAFPNDRPQESVDQTHTNAALEEEHSLIKPKDPKERDALIERLSYAGLMPFVLLSLLLWLVEDQLHPFVSIALTAYGACITSFFGGIHWGIVFKESSEQNRLHLVWGVSLSLLSWVAVVMPAFAGLPLLGLLLIVAYGVDRSSYPSAGLKHWLTLRFRLTVVASLSCFLGAAAT